MGIVRHANENIFRLRVGELETGELRVLRLRGVEAISELFEFELELVSDNAAVSFEDVIGKDVSISIAGHQEERFINGVASRFEQGAVGNEYTRYFMTVVPRWWTLSLRENCRVFQEMSTPDIISEIFATAGIPSDVHRSALQGSYEPREYCVQYNESDWAFCCRLMEEEGIFYFFEHTEEGEHVLVLGDDSSAHEQIAGESSTVPYRDPFGAVPEVEYIGHFRMSQSVAGGAYASREYNFTMPSVTLQGSDRGDAHAEFEQFEYPGEYTAEAGRPAPRTRPAARSARPSGRSPRAAASATASSRATASRSTSIPAPTSTASTWPSRSATRATSRRRSSRRCRRTTPRASTTTSSAPSRATRASARRASRRSPSSAACRARSSWGPRARRSTATSTAA